MLAQKLLYQYNRGDIHKPHQIDKPLSKFYYIRVLGVIVAPYKEPHIDERMGMFFCTPERTRQYLQHCIAKGRLASRHDECMERMRNRPYWNEADKAQDEADLAEWSHAHRMRDYAGLIEPVARGMLAVARADSTGMIVRRITFASQLGWYPVPHLLRGGSLVVLTNPARPRWRPQPEHAELFNPGGEIDVKALVLVHSEHHEVAELHVALPYRALDTPVIGHKPSGLTFMTISTEGVITALNCVPATEEPNLLMKLLGMAEGSLPVLTWPRSEHLNAAIGIPNAGYHLADELPKLEPYLNGIAVKLRPRRSSS